MLQGNLGMFPGGEPLGFESFIIFVVEYSQRIFLQLCKTPKTGANFSFAPVVLAEIELSKSDQSCAVIGFLVVRDGDAPPLRMGFPSTGLGWR